MELKLVLDFDGVLFNSAFEAYSVCNRTVADSPDYRQEVSFEEFLAFRAVVTDAWQYNRLYDRRRLVEPDAGCGGLGLRNALLRGAGRNDGRSRLAQTDGSL